MKTKRRSGRVWLRANAQAIAQELRTRGAGTRLQILQPARIQTDETDTDGWAAQIGHLGTGQPRVQIWLDRYSGHPARKLYACFYSRDAGPLNRLSRKVARHLWPARRLTESDYTGATIKVLKEQLAPKDFNAPLLENYDDRRRHYFGFYDRTRPTRPPIDRGFCERATAFVLDVARSLSGASEDNSEREAYPRCENRKLVKAHLRRERNGYLAAACKERDGHRCQVCGMTFASMYGDALGAAFAEAHHVKALGKQPDKVKTSLDDLITVCANCHHMLHRMAGGSDDVKQLRAIVRQRRVRPR